MRARYSVGNTTEDAIERIHFQEIQWLLTTRQIPLHKWRALLIERNKHPMKSSALPMVPGHSEDLPILLWKLCVSVSAQRQSTIWLKINESFCFSASWTFWWESKLKHSPFTSEAINCQNNVLVHTPDHKKHAKMYDCQRE